MSKIFNIRRKVSFKLRRFSSSTANGFIGECQWMRSSAPCAKQQNKTKNNIFSGVKVSDRAQA